MLLMSTLAVSLFIICTSNGPVPMQFRRQSYGQSAVWKNIFYVILRFAWMELDLIRIWLDIHGLAQKSLDPLFRLDTEGQMIEREYKNVIIKGEKQNEWSNAWGGLYRLLVAQDLLWLMLCRTHTHTCMLMNVKRWWILETRLSRAKTYQVFHWWLFLHTTTGSYWKWLKVIDNDTLMMIDDSLLIKLHLYQ